MMWEAGSRQYLQVAREVSPYGYFLTNGKQDVLLHYSELTRTIQLGEQLSVFLFYDTENRIAATMKQPLLTIGEVGRLVVADVHPKYGCFLEMGIGRQLLLPKEEWSAEETLPPQIGDELYVRMAHDHYGRLIAVLAYENDLLPLMIPAPQAWKNIWRTAIVYRSLPIGTFVVVDGEPIGQGIIGFIHHSLLSRTLRLGEKVKVRIAYIRPDGRVNVTMAAQKEVEIGDHATQLFTLLKQRQPGGIPYSDQTPASIVKQQFGMSKVAFKRALGRLMKADLIRQNDKGTELTEAGLQLPITQLSTKLTVAETTTREVYFHRERDKRAQS